MNDKLQMMNDNNDDNNDNDNKNDKSELTNTQVKLMHHILLPQKDYTLKIQ